MVGGTPVKIDVGRILKSRLGKRARFVPSSVVRWLERTICQDQLNELLEHNFPSAGADFCRGVLTDLGVGISVTGTENLPDRENRRIIIACNHPLGGLDGMAIIDLFSGIYGPDLKFIVNDLLMAIAPLQEVFLPINKHGAQSRVSIDAIDAAMAGDAPIVVFPAGLVSRRGKGGVICDLEWKKMFVNKAIEFHRDILPVHFGGENSGFFYKFAKFRERIGVKFNIEMVYLPREVFRSRGKTFDVTCGKPIPWNVLKGGKDAFWQAQEIKRMVYSLNP